MSATVTVESTEGQISSTGPVTLFRSLEARKLTGRVLFETELGDGQVELVGGAIVDAYLGDLFGKTALFSLLGSTEGRFEVSEEEIASRVPLVPNIDELVSEKERRAAQWRQLTERSPPLSAVLTLSPAGFEAKAEPNISAYERSLLELVDGKLTVSELIEASGIDAVDAMAHVAKGIERGWFVDVAIHNSLFPLPVAPRDAEPLEPRPEPPRVLDSGGSGTFAQSAPAIVTPLSGNPLRKRTQIGLGIPEPTRPRAVEARRVISIGPSAPTETGPIPVEPRRRTRPPPQPQGDVEPVSVAPRSSARRYVGRYELLCRIGYGGMGSVYLCRLTSEGGFRRLFALKMLRSHLAQDGQAAHKFLDEARLAGHVHHPNVVSVIDAGFDGSQPYLVMDYVEGASLKRLLAAHPDKRPADMIVPIAIDALTGLHAAHTLVSDDGRPLRIVHCDVSPENLLVGIDGVCRLADFGVARHSTSLQERSRVAHGKPGYLAPEQILGRTVDRRADVFAMGVVLYSALTGVKLFDAPTPDEILRLVCQSPIPPPSSVGLRPSPSFDFVCMKALERDPERRFSSAEEMMSLLRRVALREDLLASASQVAAWVKESVGQELSQRRLAVLDASRRPRLPPSSSATASVAGSSAPPPHRSDSPAPPSTAGVGVEVGEPSKTMLLEVPSSRRHWALIAAGVLAAVTVLATLLFPRVVSRLFRIKTEGAAAEQQIFQVPSAGAVGTAPPPADSAR